MLSQILRVIYIMKDGSDGTMSVILWKIIHNHIMGQLSFGYEWWFNVTWVLFSVHDIKFFWIARVSWTLTFA